MRVKERKYMQGGMSGPSYAVRVIDVKGDKAPEGCVVVDQETPLEDWRHEQPEEVPAETEG